MVFLEVLLTILLISFSLEDCNSNCETCLEYTTDNENMQCITCNKNLFFIVNTTNCVEIKNYLDYYFNMTDQKLYPCSLFEGTNCYECNPFLNSSGICLSCKRGYKYNNETKECIKCGEKEYAIIINDLMDVQENIKIHFVINISPPAFPMKTKKKLHVWTKLLYMII